MDEDDKKKDETDAAEEPIWLAAANTVVSLLMAVSFFFLIPWREFYEHSLLWDDATGMAVFFGVMTVLNAISLVVRARAVDLTNAKWTQIQNRYVSMSLSTLANTFFSGGLAIWCAHDQLGISRGICYLVTVTGTWGHAALFCARWQKSKSRADGLITTIYGVLTVVITLTFICNQDLF